MSEGFFTLIAAIVSAMVSALIALNVYTQGELHFFSTAISSERMSWIKEIRALSTELFSICEQYDTAELPQEQLAAFLRARNGILIRLDPIGWYRADDRLIALLSSPDFIEVRGHVPEIRDILRRILKSEWDKVKIEAGNSKWKVRKIDALQRKMEIEQTGEPFADTHIKNAS